MCARVQGHTALGDLLNTLRREGGTEEYIEQLIPTLVPINKIKLKFFGSSGVGKSTLIDSLKVGYFSRFDFGFINFIFSTIIHWNHPAVKIRKTLITEYSLELINP